MLANTKKVQEQCFSYSCVEHSNFSLYITTQITSEHKHTLTYLNHSSHTQ